MNKIKKIKNYKHKIIILSDRTDNYSMIELSTDGLAGMFTEEEWKKEDLYMFNEEEQEEIIRELSYCSNNNFFSKLEVKE